MSRREFRSRVTGPRPASAWLMSLVASSTLWVTEQLPLWIAGIQLVAFATSYLTRRDPPAFRRNPIWLNIGMLGVTSITIRSALSGNPATVSLAYFTALAQGLQLLDARPRQSEFLLVALGLFQVILASNLTDSVFFPPLVLLFLISVTWTLMVHTLQMEAIESGDPHAGDAIHAPELRRMTTLATAACVGLALILFILLPRFRSHMLEGRGGPGIALSGFSERVSLGDVGRIRKDDRVVLRIESDDEEPVKASEAYWRGLAFDDFDGRHWSISKSERIAARRSISGIGRFGIDLARESERPLRRQRIIREPVEAGVVFAAGRTHRIEGPFQHLEIDRNGGLYLPGRGDERIRYTIWSSPSERSATRLARDRAFPPLEPHPGGPRPAERYLALPDLDPRIASYAEELVRGAHNDFERALRLQETLRSQGRYTDSPPALGNGERSPVEDFILGDQEGHCEYFASAMVLLARTQGLPSRLVNGFAGGVPNEVGGFVEVTRADAHAWVEVHFLEAGWVRFDPTPPSLRLRAASRLSPWERIAQLGSAIEIWWFQRVVDFDSADQLGALRALWMRWKGDADRSSDPGEPDPGPSGPDTGGLPAMGDRLTPLLVCTLILGLASLVAWSRRGRSEPERDIPAAYREARRLLARRGWSRAPSVSARDFARSLHAELPRPAARAFDRITESYLAVRFGGQEAPDLKEPLATLTDALKRLSRT
ncbi:MAG: transglutaminase TgpA family protein [bacterium]